VREGSFASIAELVRAIEGYLAERNLAVRLESCRSRHPAQNQSRPRRRRPPQYSV
jgi:hypothetical protein